VRASLVVASTVASIVLACGCGSSQSGGGTDDGGAADLALVVHKAAPPRADVAAGYDPGAKKIVSFGGDDGPEVATVLHPHYHADTWLYDLATGDWTMSAATGPPKRGRAAAAMDVTHHKLLVALGRDRADNAPGQTPYTLLTDTWSYDVAGDAWTPLMPTGTPPGRAAPSTVYDAGSDRLVMFGGNLGASFDAFAGFMPTSETWQLKAGAAWSKVATKGPTPTARYLAATALDGANHRMIVIGGCCDNMGNFLSDVWSLDLASDTWSKLLDGGLDLSGRLGAMAALDPTSQASSVIVFGGHDPFSLGNVNDTWSLALGARPGWTSIAMGDAGDNTMLGCAGNQSEQPFNFVMPDLASPERRERGTLLAVEGGAILFGGEGDCAQLDDTWRIAGGAWTRLIRAAHGDSCMRRGDQCTCLCE
jgi:hypothetical protein